MKDLKIYTIIGALLITVYLVMQYNRPHPINWKATFNDAGKMPFDTYVLRSRITDIFPGARVKNYREPVYNVLNGRQKLRAAYVIIAGEVNLNDYDYAQLMDYIRSGNEVFIAASSFRGYLENKLNISTDAVSSDHSEPPVRFVNTHLDTTEYYHIDKHASDVFFDEIDTAKAIVLGNDTHGNINFVKYPIGKGALYLNANPLMFTNYSVLQEQGAKYSAIALSNLKNSGEIIWDEYYSQGKEGETSFMRVFLANFSLRAATYIAFFGLLIFALFEVKRRQRIIPVIEPLENTSVEFARTVGQVYYEQRNNSNIAQKKVSYFLDHIRASYFLKTTTLDDEFVNALSQKSGAAHELVRSLVAKIITVKAGGKVSDQELIALNQHIEQFYQQSR